MIRNRNSQTSQVGMNAGAGASFQATGGAAVTASIDTTQAQTLNIIGTLANGADTITLESYTVEILNP